MVTLVRKFSIVYQGNICKVLFITYDDKNGLQFGVAMDGVGGTLVGATQFQLLKPGNGGDFAEVLVEE